MSEDGTPTIGGRLRLIRSERKLSPAEFAVVAGCPVELVADVEGDRDRPSAEIVAAIVDLGYSPTWLLTGCKPKRLPEPKPSGAEPENMLDQPALPTDAIPTDPLPAILGSSQGLSGLIRRVGAAAVSGRNVLLIGEPGTGKELAAHGIHDYSLHPGGPFVPFDCARIAPSDIPQTAGAGTLFLYEIAALNPTAQRELVLQTKRDVPARLIAATSTDSTCLGLDLAHLFPVTIELPRLRDRGDDIPLIVDHLLRTYRSEANRDKLEFSASAWTELLCYGFPGNVREMQYLMRYVVNLEPREEIGLATLKEAFRNSAHQEYSRLDGYGLQATERALILAALRNHSGNLAAVAHALGVSRLLLQLLVFHLGIKVPHFDPAA